MTSHSRQTSESAENSQMGEQPKALQSTRIVWKNVHRYIYLHIAALYGSYLMITSSKWQTSIFAIALYILSCLGITAGAHRLWTHRSYKARLPLRVFLAVLDTLAIQNDIFEWARDHRVHHKFSETDADPHNAKRGFFFSHIGWLMVKKHPEVLAKGKNVDISDILADPVVRFQRKHYVKLVILFSLVLPTAIPVFFWGESFWNAFFVAVMFRYVFSLNQTWLVNSAAHMWGNRPYDMSINPRENYWVVFGAIGEGFHNYHHTFPWDYATSEYGFRYNFTTTFINVMAWFGLAYDLKTASPEVIMDRKQRTGELCRHLAQD